MVGKSLPAKWKRINVHDNRAALGVGARISYPNNLFLKKQTNSPNLFADWLPHEEEDPRVVPKGKKRRAKATNLRYKMTDSNGALLDIANP